MMTLHTRMSLFPLVIVMVSVVSIAVAGERANAEVDGVEVTQRVEDTDTDGAMRPRREAERFYAAGFGPANLWSVGSQGIAYAFYGQTYWEVDPRAGIRAIGEMTTDFTDGLLMDLGLGANLFFAETPDVSPFVAGDLGFGYGRGRGDNALGFSLGASGGVILFRSSTRQMQVEARVGTILDQIDGAFPTQIAGRIGLVF
jgi:hypothetical protein